MIKKGAVIVVILGLLLGFALSRGGRNTPENGKGLNKVSDSTETPSASSETQAVSQQVSQPAKADTDPAAEKETAENITPASSSQDTPAADPESVDKNKDTSPGDSNTETRTDLESASSETEGRKAGTDSADVNPQEPDADGIDVSTDKSDFEAPAVQDPASSETDAPAGDPDPASSENDPYSDGQKQHEAGTTTSYTEEGGELEPGINPIDEVIDWPAANPDSSPAAANHSEQGPETDRPGGNPDSGSAAANHSEQSPETDKPLDNPSDNQRDMPSEEGDSTDIEENETSMMTDF